MAEPMSETAKCRHCGYIYGHHYYPGSYCPSGGSCFEPAAPEPCSEPAGCLCSAECHFDCDEAECLCPHHAQPATPPEPPQIPDDEQITLSALLIMNRLKDELHGDPEATVAQLCLDLATTESALAAERAKREERERMLDADSWTIDRVWAALGTALMESNPGVPLWDLVRQQRTKREAAETRVWNEAADLLEMWGDEKAARFPHGSTRAAIRTLAPRLRHRAQPPQQTAKTEEQP